MAGDGREGGYIKLHRRLKSWPLWRSMSPLQRMVWLEMLFAANWKDDVLWYGTKRIEVKRGQLAHSEAELARRAEVGRKVVRDTIAKLLAEGAISREPGLPEGQCPHITTILNYDRYQGNDDDEGPAKGQGGAKLGPSSGPARALREEWEEGKKEERAPEDKPPAPAAEPFRLGTEERRTIPEPVAEKVGPKRPSAAGSAKADPDRRRLSDALVAVGREERGGTFAFDGVKDGQAVTRLLGWSRDVAEHARRFRLALRAPAVEYGYRVDTISAFATGRIWNHFASTAPAAPTRLRPLGSPGGA